MTDRTEIAPLPIVSLALHVEDDVVRARQHARTIAAALGCDAQDQVRFATAVSELARNAWRYARGGQVHFGVLSDDAGSFAVARVVDEGPGIADLAAVLGGAYVSRTGMGVGLAGARRLVERFAAESTDRGTSVLIGKQLPANAPMISQALVRGMAERLGGDTPPSSGAELARVRRDLAMTMELLRDREAEGVRVAQELADTNRGVVALYAELDDRAQELARMSESKTRFLSDVSHELRTPLSSIVNLSRLLLSHIDGPLLDEQERQVTMIRRSAEWLAEMVNELLDVAKIESGIVELRADAFHVHELFGALRGTLRPLATNDAVALVIEDPAVPLELFTDEQRVAQVLRNFVSNALKFTPAGDVRVTAEPADGDMIRFTVTDTGIGIAAADRARVFKEFVQVDGPIQRRVRGTGLGLPLTVKLAHLLGGTVSLASEVGAGSRFSLCIPRDVRTVRAEVAAP